MDKVRFKDRVRNRVGIRMFFVKYIGVPEAEFTPEYFSPVVVTTIALWNSASVTINAEACIISLKVSYVYTKLLAVLADAFVSHSMPGVESSTVTRKQNRLFILSHMQYCLCCLAACAVQDGDNLCKREDMAIETITSFVV